MKFRSILFKLLGLIMILGMSLVSCEGPEGPDGPIGPIGPAGPQGIQGPEGMAGTTNCIDCHAAQKIAVKMFQYEKSVHYTGGHFYENRTSCAGCHTSQGFLERIQTGAMRTAEEIEDPLPPNCYACHKIHQSFTEADWELTTADPVFLWINNEMVDYGKGNLCISCHQARVRNPLPPGPDDTGMLYVTSTRYGPHHGPQGPMLAGTGGSELQSGFQNSFHSILLASKDGCIQCHMATYMPGEGHDDSGAGGHTFAVHSLGIGHSDEIEHDHSEINTAGCVECHMDEDELFDMVEDVQTEIEDLKSQLGSRLVELGLLVDTINFRTIRDTFPANQVGALWNYQFVREDKSRGVHNYKYAKALLESSLDAVNP